MHWINFPLLTVMIWSGLRIYWADLRDPFVLGIGGWEIFEFIPDGVNESLGLNRKLARGMAFHFTFGWLFVLNGLAFAIYLWRTGGWRNFVPTRDDLRTIPAVLSHEVGLRKESPPQGKYNGVQQLSYGAILLMGVLAIVSGFAIYKPTQLSLLTTLLGGYSSARFIHFAVTIGFLLFFVIHILQVARAGVSNFFSMITGYQLLPKQGPLPRHGTTELRVNARSRDVISVILIPAFVILFLAALDPDPNPGWFGRIAALVVALGFLWDVVWVGLRGATPGKRAHDLKVVRTGTDDQPALWRSFIRALGWVPLSLLFADSRSVLMAGIGLVALLGIVSLALILRDPKRRSLFDIIAGTEVVAVGAEESVPGLSPEVEPIHAAEVAR